MLELETTQLDEILQYFKTVFTERVPFCKLLSIGIDEIKHNKAVMSFSMQEKLVGNILNGGLHGGVTASILDSVGGLLAMTSVIDRHREGSQENMLKMLGRTSTINININYLSPGVGKTFKAIAKPIHTGNKIFRAQMMMENETGAHLAEATGIYLIG